MDVFIFIVSGATYELVTMWGLLLSSRSTLYLLHHCYDQGSSWLWHCSKRSLFSQTKYSWNCALHMGRLPNTPRHPVNFIKTLKGFNVLRGHTCVYVCFKVYSFVPCWVSFSRRCSRPLHALWPPESGWCSWPGGWGERTPSVECPSPPVGRGRRKRGDNEVWWSEKEIKTDGVKMGQILKKGGKA